ncbi:MAG: cell wall hydrolase [Alphaproteobacteria bacterium]|nr:cell wall hydrolase [Alphaproteobacteria bacterium]
MTTDRLVLPALRLPPMPRLRHWLASLVLVTTAALYLVAGLSVTALQPVATPAHANVPRYLPLVPGLGLPPQPEPLRFRDVAPQDALAINAGIPVSDSPNPAARPFDIHFASVPDRARALDCLTAAVYYEAAIETDAGQRAVAQVVLNRVRHPAFPKSVCGVVFQGSERATGCQFTFTCDGALRRTPSAQAWSRARMVAEEALAGKVFAPVGWATHYHTNWVVPYWSSTLVKSALVGTQIFYRWEGGWGRAPAFRLRGNGVEPQFALMRPLSSDAALLADAQDPATLAAAAAAAAGTDPAATNPDLKAAKSAAVAGSIDSFQRAVLRRYEPMTSDAADAELGRKVGNISPAMRWALSGLPAKPGEAVTAHGQAAPAAKAADAPAVKPAAPRCLDGVRRLPELIAGPSEKQAC